MNCYNSYTSEYYYPFGMVTPGRSYSAGSGYRFGFNGKESDAETYGSGNIYDYGFRIYNPRIGKFLSVDPLTKEYSDLTPFQFASNTPIQAIDLDGLEMLNINSSMYRQKYEGPAYLSYDKNKWQVFQYSVQTINHNIPKHYHDNNPWTEPGPFGKDLTWSGQIMSSTGTILERHPDPGDDDGSEPMMPNGGGRGQYNQSTGFKPSIRGSRASAQVTAAIFIVDLTGYLAVEVPKYGASRKEALMRRALYLATNMVDDVVQKSTYFEEMNLTALIWEEGRADLINYIVDGTLPAFDNLKLLESEYLIYINMIETAGRDIIEVNYEMLRSEGFDNAKIPENE